MTLPSKGKKTPRHLVVPKSFDRVTHYLFRYPAKFHPPIVRKLIEEYTQPGELILDPFCGSGTLQVEAMLTGRNSIGLDIDPLAIAVATAKTTRLDRTKLRRAIQNVLAAAQPYRFDATSYEETKFGDLTKRDYASAREAAADWIPAIPNLDHWFRRYVTIDLACLRYAVETAKMTAVERQFMRVVFASIIRNASNADPVPVSGLEVTSHMIKRDEDGRVIDPFTLFEDAAKKAADAADAFERLAVDDTTTRAVHGDATRLSEYITETADAVITSPPYHGAVDYYRRHQLEMFWLGLTETQQDRLDLLDQYIGRPHVPQRHEWVANGVLKTALAKEWEAKIRLVSDRRGDEFRHYLVSMSMFFEQLALRVKPGGPALLVVGNSAWNSTEIPTTHLFAEIAGDGFDLEEVLSYPVKNRYMSYTRRNGADISTEYVLVLRRGTPTPDPNRPPRSRARGTC